MKNGVLITCLSLFLFRLQGMAQTDTLEPTLTFSGYLEAYYAYDFNQPKGDGFRPPMLYSFNRHNEFNINLGMIKTSYLAQKVRANAAFAAGTYVNANYTNEPGVLKNLLEMNVGVRLSKKQDLWLDAGIFGSHIGFESAIGKDCRSLTRSLMAENSPYYETGAKLTYQSSDKQWMLSGLILNGWQRIQRQPQHSLPAFGTQIQFKPSDKILLNSSTFIGSEYPDELRRMRYFHNFYGIFQLSEQWEATAAFDIGWEQSRPESSEYNSWNSSVLMLRYAANNEFSMTLRGEWYQDNQGVILNLSPENGFEAMGISFNIDYAVTPNAVWRLEGRYLNAPDELFFDYSNNNFTSHNACVTSSLAISF